MEAETADTDGDGTPDYLESSVTDTDGDGFADQADRANNDQCIPVDSGPGCGTVTPPPTSSGGGGSFSLA